MIQHSYAPPTYIWPCLLQTKTRFVLGRTQLGICVVLLALLNEMYFARGLCYTEKGRILTCVRTEDLYCVDFPENVPFGINVKKIGSFWPEKADQGILRFFTGEGG